MVDADFIPVVNLRARFERRSVMNDLNRRVEIRDALVAVSAHQFKRRAGFVRSGGQQRGTQAQVAILARTDANTVSRQHLRMLISSGDNVNYQTICHRVDLKTPQTAHIKQATPLVTAPNTLRGLTSGRLHVPYYNNNRGASKVVTERAAAFRIPDKTAKRPSCQVKN